MAGTVSASLRPAARRQHACLLGGRHDAALSGCVREMPGTILRGHRAEESLLRWDSEAKHRRADQHRPGPEQRRLVMPDAKKMLLSAERLRERAEIRRGGEARQRGRDTDRRIADQRTEPPHHQPAAASTAAAPRAASNRGARRLVMDRPQRGQNGRFCQLSRQTASGGNLITRTSASGQQVGQSYRGIRN
jgi:hypothetical protein